MVKSNRKWICIRIQHQWRTFSPLFSISNILFSSPRFVGFPKTICFWPYCFYILWGDLLLQFYSLHWTTNLWLQTNFSHKVHLLNISFTRKKCLNCQLWNYLGRQYLIYDLKMKDIKGEILKGKEFLECQKKNIFCMNLSSYQVKDDF